MLSRLAALVSLLFFSLPAAAQEITLDMAAGSVKGQASARVIQLVVLVTILSLAPSILIMATSFTRISVVMSLLRSALGTQGSPSNMILISLSLFLTGFIMAPTLQKSWEQGVQPMIAEQVSTERGVSLAVQPFREFMLKNVREKDLGLFLSMTAPPDAKGEPAVTAPEDTPLAALAPAFMISELRRAFEIGFLLFIPFLVIDMLVASVLMSMGMMMVPPSMVSLPFKLIFFVLVDGWYLLAGSLMQSFAR
ncbi:flagellar biosynthetic protein FliP [Alphaproteobacteria bacterium]|nr:flagellar biosynthetic protein FliP [Alphaproteobacteria bacterium]